MKEEEVEPIIQRARERFPGVTPRIISDNGPQFVARDFKEFIRIRGMTHINTSPCYPQSKPKIERFHRTFKGDCSACCPTVGGNRFGYAAMSGTRRTRGLRAPQ